MSKTEMKDFNEIKEFKDASLCWRILSKLYHLLVKSYVQGTSGLLSVDIKEGMLLLETFCSIAPSKFLLVFVYFPTTFIGFHSLPLTHSQGFIQRALSSRLTKHWNRWVKPWLFDLVSNAMAKTENIKWQGMRQAWEIQDG